MQASCINLCARMAQDAFVSIGRDSGIAGFWGNRVFGDEAEKGNRFSVTFAQCPFLYMATLCFFSCHSR